MAERWRAWARIEFEACLSVSEYNTPRQRRSSGDPAALVHDSVLQDWDAIYFYTYLNFNKSTRATASWGSSIWGHAAACVPSGAALAFVRASSSREQTR